MSLSEQYEELLDWWRGVSDSDAAKTLPKAQEYGSADLRLMGAAMLELLPNGEELPPRLGQEMAIAFYLLGKIARMIGAYAGGQEPSLDTLMDTRIYAMMLQRVRDKGEWV